MHSLPLPLTVFVLSWRAVKVFLVQSCLCVSDCPIGSPTTTGTDLHPVEKVNDLLVKWGEPRNREIFGRAIFLAEIRARRSTPLLSYNRFFSFPLAFIH